MQEELRHLQEQRSEESLESKQHLESLSAQVSTLRNAFGTLSDVLVEEIGVCVCVCVIPTLFCPVWSCVLTQNIYIHVALPPCTPVPQILSGMMLGKAMRFEFTPSLLCKHTTEEEEGTTLLLMTIFNTYFLLFLPTLTLLWPVAPCGHVLLLDLHSL